MASNRNFIFYFRIHLFISSEAGYKCIRAFSIWDSPVAALVQEGVDVEFYATVQHNDQLADQNLATNQVSYLIITHINPHQL